jgi:hypothetical protein
MEQIGDCFKMTSQQLVLAPKIHTTYGKPQYNYVRGNTQRIELHRGCPHGHEYCYEPKIYEDFPIPELLKNQVQILDMNLLARKDALQIIRQLGLKIVNGKFVHYEAVCGFDFRFLTQEIAYALKDSWFFNIRLAWDGSIKDQYRLKDALTMLKKAGYETKKINFFMIVNWKIPKAECERKLDIMKVWNVKVCDCCYDGGYKYATPTYWKGSELKEFRAKCRKHNHLVIFGIDPEAKQP